MYLRKRLQWLLGVLYSKLVVNFCAESRHLVTYRLVIMICYSVVVIFTYEETCHVMYNSNIPSLCNINLQSSVAQTQTLIKNSLIQILSSESAFELKCVQLSGNYMWSGLFNLLTYCYFVHFAFTYFYSLMVFFFVVHFNLLTYSRPFLLIYCLTYSHSTIHILRCLSVAGHGGSWSQSQLISRQARYCTSCTGNQSITRLTALHTHSYL